MKNRTDRPGNSVFCHHGRSILGYTRFHGFAFTQELYIVACKQGEPFHSDRAAALSVARKVV